VLKRNPKERKGRRNLPLNPDDAEGMLSQENLDFLKYVPGLNIIYTDNKTYAHVEYRGDISLNPHTKGVIVVSAVFKPSGVGGHVHIHLSNPSKDTPDSIPFTSVNIPFSTDTLGSIQAWVSSLSLALNALNSITLAATEPHKG
jgi:hypothetical protein